MDVIIIGAGVIGASIARALSKYQMDILVIEKDNDVGDGASCANSAILHSGYDPEPGSLKARLNVLGNQMFDEISRDLDVQMRRIGSITVASTDEEIEALGPLQKRAEQNQVPLQLLNREELLKLEPFLHPSVRFGLYAPTAGILNPFELTVASMENAMDNGVKLHLREEVIAIKRLQEGFLVTTNQGTYETKIVVNCAGVHSDAIHNMVHTPEFTIKPRRGEYYVIDNLFTPYIKHVIFGVPTKAGKGVLVAPTTHDNYLVGPSSDFIEDKEDTATHADILKMVKDRALTIVSTIPFPSMIRQFAGIRAVSSNDDFIIQEASHGFFDVAGIQSPGLASSPAIAKMVEDMIIEKYPTTKKENYNPRRRRVVRLKECSLEERTKLIKENPLYGHIICRCEGVSEAEVIDCIHRHAGATTIKGVKKRTRPGAGRCQGGFCEPHIIEILSRELGRKKTEIEYAKIGSNILQKRPEFREESQGEPHENH
ncbi:MAG: NAD(P)/FAD-dependent oxidoreductase [Bacilli bacterium]|nr:NAD(P)/FAD-dependent oxidoreductase [Bacilli bacterium]